MFFENFRIRVKLVSILSLATHNQYMFIFDLIAFDIGLNIHSKDLHKIQN